MKVWKVEEYCMYFPLFKLHRCANRFAAQPQTIYSEVPYKDILICRSDQPCAHLPCCISFLKNPANTIVVTAADRMSDTGSARNTANA